MNEQDVGPVDLAARPRQNWPSHVTRLLDGNVIYVNPHDFTAYAFKSIDLLALLWDRVVIDSPRESLFPETAYQSPLQVTYPLDRFLAMVERDIFIPYDWDAAVNDRRAGRAGAYWRRGQFQRIIDSGNYILREEITRSTKFYDYCRPLVDQDTTSAELKAIIEVASSSLPLEDTNLNLRPGTPDEIQHRVALALNWHGTLAQLLGADMFIHPRMRAVWDYKAKVLPAQRDVPDLDLQLQAFIDRLRLDLPTGLPVQDIAAFRATNEAKNFRQWLITAFQAAQNQASEVPCEERVYLEFQRLCNDHRRRNDSVVSRVTSLASTLGSGAAGLAMGGLPGALVSSAVGLGLGEGLKPPLGAASRWWKRKLGGDWTFFFIKQFEQ